MTAREVVRLKQQLAERTGLSMGLLQQPGLSEFVQRRLVTLGLDDESTYYRLVLRDADEMERLVQEVSVPETWFFRYPESFRLLAEHCSGLLQRREGKLRMLSIACATGEEPYGMAMTAVHAGWPLQGVVVDAVDRNEASLQIAREANYGKRSFREPIPDWAQQWLRRTDRGTQVHAGIVGTVHFQCQDILGSSLLRGDISYDAIFCRNLLIYLRTAARKDLADLLSARLATDGILFVGHAEQATLPQTSFEPVNSRHTFALRPRQPGLAQQDPVFSRSKPVSRPAGRRSRRSELGANQEPMAARGSGSACSRSKDPRGCPCPGQCGPTRRGTGRTYRPTIAPFSQSRVFRSDGKHSARHGAA